MKKVFHNIFSIVLALLVLFSTFSFTVEKHLCMGRVADYSFIGNLERCMDPQENDSNDLPIEVKKIPCCSDVTETIQGTNTELKVVKELELEQVQFVAVFFYTYINLFEGLQENTIPFKGHSPPILTKDITVLYETYLI